VIVGSDRPELRTELIDAIHRDRLSAWADAAVDSSGDDCAGVAELVEVTCRRIRTANEAERDRLVELLSAVGVPVAVASVSDQRHTLRVEVAPSDAVRASAVLRHAGFQSSRTWTAGALQSWWRVGDSQVFTLDGPSTVVVQLRWRQRRRGRLQQLFGPTPADWNAVTLPGGLWWAYSIVRPVRLLAERLGLRSADHSALEPFLVTPTSLIGSLLDVASVGVDDVVFDFGSGDGRFVIAAATARGCRSIGVEQSSELCAVAVARAADAGVADRVSIVNADAADVDLSEVTVVVLFLPMVVASRVVPDLLMRLSPGARIVLHEQTALAASIPRPDSEYAVVVDDAVTVANRWNVGG
jgi:SAM-dependent methyltransferase